jgi:hypothetical protein
VRIEGFEAHSNDGRMQVLVSNIGNIPGDFLCGVENCTNKVAPIAAKTLSLKAMQSSLLYFNIYTESDKGKSHDCAVFLKDAYGRLVDAKNTTFNSTDKVIESNQDPQNFTQDGEEIRYEEANNGEFKCGDKCNFYDIVCFFLHVNPLN